jgi:hypothetical protein
LNLLKAVRNQGGFGARLPGRGRCHSLLGVPAHQAILDRNVLD